MKVLLLLLFYVLQLYALEKNDIIGNWQAVTHTRNNGTLTIEKEYFTLKKDDTFSIEILVSVQKMTHT